MNRPSDHTGPRATGFHAGRFYRVLAAAAFVLVFVLALGVGATLPTSASTQASFTSASSVNAPAAQATASSPEGVPTIVIPLASGVVPNPVPTRGTNPDANTDLPPGSNTNKPGSTTPGRPSNDFPWLAIIILAAVVLLGILAYFLLRSRRTALPVGMAPGPSAAGTPSARVAVPGATMPIMAPVATGAAVFTPPSTLTCPNCGSTNDWNENFCHECGQDLRPVRAAVISASGPPADVVTDDMPYLETLDRTDEQLEYVLSRQRVVVGTTAGCDVMVDGSFKDSATVSPRHAQLLRNDDGTFTITDLGSPTGVSINDVRIAANTPVPLSNGDTIKVGNVRFVYRVPLQGS
ncbi:MAG TPA: FHA domain-containing protein [Chloroflexia bacterium]|nr:FHA domain-containing protein [Chloroflexia bacterium]